MSASARRRSTNRRQSSTVTPLLSWTAPRLANSRTSGATARTSNVSSTSGCSSSTRLDPSPMARPAPCATSASAWLISLASAVPPVMEEMSSGAARRRPNSSADVSTWSRSSSGSAWCVKRYCSKPLVTPLAETSERRLMRMWSALRLTVVAAGRRPFSEISPDVVGRIWSARVVCDMACEPLQLVGGTGRSTGVLLMLTFRIRLPEGNYLVKLFCRTATAARSAIVHMVQKAPPGGRPPAPLQGAFPADPYHEHVSPNRVEPVPLLQVALELGHQAVLDVQDTLADLADGVLVVLDRDLVVNGT